MLNKPFNAVRNKAWSRSRQTSGEEVGNSGMGGAKTKEKENRRMVRSQTTSFLPVPSKVNTIANLLYFHVMIVGFY